jgi:hypothetical protein
MVWLIIVAAVFMLIWVHGVYRAHMYRSSLSTDPVIRGRLAVPGLVSPIAAPARLRAELSRAQRLGATVHVAIATVRPDRDPLEAAHLIANSLAPDMMGLLWDEQTVVVMRPEPILPDELAAWNVADWTMLDSTRREDIDNRLTGTV